MRSSTTRYAQLSKYRTLWAALSDWQGTLPLYLDWTKHNSALSTHVYLKLQRPFIETQFECIRMKLNWSIAHLDPLLMVKFQSLWDVGDAKAECLQAGQRVLAIIDEIGTPSDSYRLYHWEAVRATTTLVQMALRHDMVEGERRMDLVDSCRRGIEISRKLIPAVLARIESTLENTLEEYVRCLKGN